MVTKYVHIEFANPKIRAAWHLLPDISEAVEHASHNLYLRHKVKVKMPLIVHDSKVIIKMEIPENIAEKFNAGNHLRGVSQYLLKLRPDYYKKFTIGNRLLFYVDVSNDKDYQRYWD